MAKLLTANSANRLPMSPAFDDHRPPSADIIADCVHCGFCLPTCPTYLLWGEEMDSPRGRIVLMKAAVEREIPLSDTTVRHFDQCLGCMACVTACPSGVRYDRLIEATRAQVERRHSRSPSERLMRAVIFALFPHPRRLKSLAPAIWLYQKSGLTRLLRSGRLRRWTPAPLRSMLDLTPQVSARTFTARYPASVPAQGERRLRVGLVLGCVQRVFFPNVNDATIRVLTAEGCEVSMPRGQGCCGALSVHAGREEEGLAFARRMITVFEREDVDVVVTNAAGCGSVLKEYGDLLRDDPVFAERAKAFSAKVRDALEFIAGLDSVTHHHPIQARVAYHDACHLAHAQGIRKQPRELLRSIPGVELVEIAEADLCCGSAGVYNILEPDPALALGDRKARHVAEACPDILTAANPGCLLQIQTALERAGERVPTAHPIELLDASIRGVTLHERRSTASSRSQSQ